MLTVHSALNHFIEVKEYNIKQAFVLYNERMIYKRGVITYIPIYYFYVSKLHQRSGG